MVQKLFALLACGGQNCLEDLRAPLKGQGFGVCRERTSEEVTRLLDQTHPELILIASNLPDGKLNDIVGFTGKASVPTSVIVVGKSKDTRRYLSTTGYEVLDFFLPPFEMGTLTHIVRVAAEDARHRPAAQSIRAAN